MIDLYYYSLIALLLGEYQIWLFKKKLAPWVFFFFFYIAPPQLPWAWDYCRREGRSGQPIAEAGVVWLKCSLLLCPCREGRRRRSCLCTEPPAILDLLSWQRWRIIPWGEVKVATLPAWWIVRRGGWRTAVKNGWVKSIICPAAGNGWQSFPVCSLLFQPQLYIENVLCVLLHLTIQSHVCSVNSNILQTNILQ